MWAEQTKDELIKHYMLSAYYRFSASGAPVTEENTQSLFLRSFEIGVVFMLCRTDPPLSA